jgi:hypothetical protein
VVQRAHSEQDTPTHQQSKPPPGSLPASSEQTPCLYAVLMDQIYFQQFELPQIFIRQLSPLIAHLCSFALALAVVPKMHEDHQPIVHSCVPPH